MSPFSQKHLYQEKLSSDSDLSSQTSQRKREVGPSNSQPLSMGVNMGFPFPSVEGWRSDAQANSELEFETRKKFQPWEIPFEQNNVRIEIHSKACRIIGKRLPREDADALFSAYAKLIFSSSPIVEEFGNAFHAVFPLEKISSRQMRQGIAFQAHVLLQDVAEALQENKPVSIPALIEQFESMLKAQKSYLFDISHTLLQIRQACPSSRI